MAFRLFCSGGVPLARQFIPTSASAVLSVESVIPTRAPAQSFHGLRHFSHDRPDSNAINFNVASKIEGEDSQRLTVELLPGQSLKAATNAVVKMMISPSGMTIQRTVSSSKSPFFSRVYFLHDYLNTGNGSTTISLQHMYALNSNIMRLNMSDYGNQLFCVWPGLLCLSSSIDIESRRIGSILGGFVTGTDKRFTLHKLTGQGEVFLSGPGLSKVDIDHGTLVEFPSHRVIAFTEGMNPRIDQDTGIRTSPTLITFLGTNTLRLIGPGTIFIRDECPAVLEKYRELQANRLISLVCFYYGSIIIGKGIFFVIFVLSQATYKAFTAN